MWEAAVSQEEEGTTFLIWSYTQSRCDTNRPVHVQTELFYLQSYTTRCILNVTRPEMISFIVGEGGGAALGRGETEHVSVPEDIDLNTLPQFCFPGIWISIACAHTFTQRHIYKTRNSCLNGNVAFRLLILAWTLKPMWKWLKEQCHWWLLDDGSRKSLTTTQY